MLCGDLNVKEVQKGEDICIYIYVWFILLYSRKEHNIVKQLYSSKINLNLKNKGTVILSLFKAISTALDGEAVYNQRDWELTVAQIMNSLMPNSDLNWRQ